MRFTRKTRLVDLDTQNRGARVARNLDARTNLRSTLATRADFVIGLAFCLAVVLGFLLGLHPVAGISALLSVISIGVILACDRRRAVALCALMSLIILVLVPIVRLSGPDEIFRVPALLAVSGLAVLALIRSKTNTRPRSFLSVSLLALCGLAANLTAGDHKQWQALGLFVWIGAIGILFGTLVFAERVQGTVARGFIFAASIQAGIAIYEVFFGMRPLWRGGRILDGDRSAAMSSDLLPGFARAQGSLGHPLPLSMLLLCGVVVALTPGVVRGQFARVCTVVLLGTGIMVSGSRSGAVLFFLILLVLWGSARREVVFARFAIIALPLIVIGVVTLYGLMVDFVASGSWTHRLGSFKVVGSVFNAGGAYELVFGNGISSSPRLLKMGLLQDEAFLAVDNQFVLLYTQFGISGLAIVLVVIYLAFVRSSAALRPLVLLCVAQLWVFDFFGWPSMLFIFWFLVGAANRDNHRRNADCTPTVQEDGDGERASGRSPGESGLRRGGRGHAPLARGMQYAS